MNKKNLLLVLTGLLLAAEPALATNKVFHYYHGFPNNAKMVSVQGPISDELYSYDTASSGTQYVWYFLTAQFDSTRYAEAGLEERYNVVPVPGNYNTYPQKYPYSVWVDSNDDTWYQVGQGYGLVTTGLTYKIENQGGTTWRATVEASGYNITLFNVFDNACSTAYFGSTTIETTNCLRTTNGNSAAAGNNYTQTYQFSNAWYRQPSGTMSRWPGSTWNGGAPGCNLTPISVGSGNLGSGGPVYMKIY